MPPSESRFSLVDRLLDVLVGTKCDLEDERQVTEQEGQDLAATLHCPFFETSAKAGINIEEAFYELTREVRQTRDRHRPPQPKRSCTLS